MSNYVKTIMCLASSKKEGGRCVAGKSMSPGERGQWIRPVSVRTTAEISLDERRYEDGQEPQLLDIIDIPMMAPVPRSHQSENHMIDSDEYWRKTGTAAWDDLHELVDNPSNLWGIESSTNVGLFDRVTPATAAKLTNSLWLIRPRDVTIRVLTPGAAFGNSKRKVRARFEHNGTQYDFMVTDLVAEPWFLARPNGDFRIEQNAYFCVSLGEAHTDSYGNTFCYKLVAAIITERPLK